MFCYFDCESSFCEIGKSCIFALLTSMVGVVHAVDVGSGCTSMCVRMCTHHSADVIATVGRQSRKYNKSWLKMASVSWQVRAAGRSLRAPLLGA